MNTWIEKQRYIIDFTISSLLRRKVKNIGLLTLYTMILFILTSTMFFTYSIKREAKLILQGSPEIVVQQIIAGRHDLLPTSYITEIEAIRGVASIEPRLWGYYYDSQVQANYTLLAPSKPVDVTETQARTTVVVEPNDPHAADVNKPLYDYDGAPPEVGSTVIGNGVARMREIGAGDYMPFMAFDGQIVNLKVAGTLSAESELVSSDLILVNDNDFRNLFGIPNTFVTDVIVTVKNPREMATVAGKIKKKLHSSRPIIREEILRTYDSIFNWRGGMMIVIFSAAVLAFVIFAWDKASGLSAGERREIGILKAVGWETSDVIQMKFWEGAMVSLTAFFSGVMFIGLPKLFRIDRCPSYPFCCYRACWGFGLPLRHGS